MVLLVRSGPITSAVTIQRRVGHFSVQTEVNPRGGGVVHRTRAGGEGVGKRPPPNISPELMIRSERFKRHSIALVRSISKYPGLTFFGDL